MQTFLPFPDFLKSLNCLDDRRLGKQRVEAKQLINLIQRLQQNSFLSRGKIAYGNHPATIMWEKNLDALTIYYNQSLMVWASRGFKNEKCQFIQPQNKLVAYSTPWWLGVDIFHRSHQSNLLRKKPAFYRDYFSSSVPNNLPYLWPKVVNGQQTFVEGK